MYAGKMHSAGSLFPEWVEGLRFWRVRSTSLFAILGGFTSMACAASQPAVRDGEKKDATVSVQEAGASMAADGAMVDSVPDPPGTWRSVLFGKEWKPMGEGGAPDEMGRFLHDFSYAGYHLGEVKPPYGQGTMVAQVDAALGDGKSDATMAIQTAIDRGCAAGGGVVQIPAGTYRVRLPSVSANAALTIPCSRLVLRGEGLATRILFDDAQRARQKSVLALRGGGSIWTGAGEMLLTQEVDLPTRQIQVSDASAFSSGQWVILRTDVTVPFRVEHRMDGAANGTGTDWWPEASFRGLYYPRRIDRVEGTTIHLDVPTRYPVKTRDRARIYRLTSWVEESGIESLAVGMVENRRTTLVPESAHDESYNTVDTTPYEVHASAAIEISQVHDAWIYNVSTFLPEGNTASSAHVLSNGIELLPGAFRITVEKCSMGRPQYRGGGGNGYLFHVQGSDNLFVDVRAEDARHGLILNQAASGNVFLRAEVVGSRLSDDAHRYLAQANLYDQVSLDRAWLQAVNRGATSTGGGFTSTGHVFWNTRVVQNHPSAHGCAVESSQWAWGYAIGSQAQAGQSARLCPVSFSNRTWAGLDKGDPTDFVEGEGQGASLVPVSLYDAQRALRCVRQGRVCK